MTFQNCRQFPSKATRRFTVLLVSAVLPPLWLGACGPSVDEGTAGALSADDVRALDEAAAKLDADNERVSATAPGKAPPPPGKNQPAK